MRVHAALNYTRAMSFEIQKYLADRKTMIDDALAVCLPDEHVCPANLAASMRHAVLTGGKRLRPILCLAAAEAAGGSPDAALCPACAVELLHAYTLVHDDLPCMDNDLTRRGQPTVHVKYGEAVAVLAGDALLTLAFETLSRTPETRPGLSARLVGELASATGASGVIAGQIDDIGFTGSVSRETVESVFRHKTAGLFRAAVRLGALTANTDAAVLDKLSVFAEGLGMAFQITDDLLDAAEKNDAKHDEMSCLYAMSAADARAWAASQTSAALAALQGLPGPTRALSEIASLLLNRRH